MKCFGALVTSCVLFFTSAAPLHAHSDGAMTIHEITQDSAPKANLKVMKDPTGGFNVHIATSNFVWRPEMASMKHVVGEGHVHVYLDGKKIMRIYNEWFHLNTYQFATRAGEQLLSIEFVGNDHAPYAIRGVPIGVDQIVNVAIDEVQPAPPSEIKTCFLFIPLLALAIFLFWRKQVR